MEHYSALDFGILPGKIQDGLALRRMINWLGDKQDFTIHFAPGRYEFDPSYAFEKCLCISNHDDDGLKRIAFDLSGWKKATLDFAGAEFVFHGDIIPFYCKQAQEVTLKNVSVDYATPIYSQAEIVKAAKRQITVRIDQERSALNLLDGKAYFQRSGQWDSLYYALAFDPIRDAPASGAQDWCVSTLPKERGIRPRWQKTGEKEYTLSLPDDSPEFPGGTQQGNILVLRHHKRTHPAFYCTDSGQITLRDITVKHSEGMAALFERVCGVTLEHFDVRRPRDGRIYSATADATHFVLCTGTIHITHCVMENQMDDAVNVHGIYAKCIEQPDNRSALLKLVHPQQLGVVWGQKGDTVAWIDSETMLPFFKTVLKDIQQLNKDCILVEFCDSVPHFTGEAVLENKSANTANVIIDHCVFRNNRARGLLLTGSEKTEVFNNLFETSGAAVLVEGDAASWFESGAIKQLHIHHNRFEGCAYIPQWGGAVIRISPVIRRFVNGRAFHGNIVVEENSFRNCCGTLVAAKSVERLSFQRNSVHNDKKEQECFRMEHVLDFEHDR